MAEDASAFAALGLEPGADAVAIEQAYKRLIKEHHPDREGGNSARAAEINRAYRELRVTRNLKEPLELNQDWPEAALSVRRGWPALAVTAAVGAASLLLLAGPLGPSTDSLRSPSMPRLSAAQDKPHADAMDQPLNLGAIAEAARRAQNLARSSDEMELASVSRDCHHRLRNDPTLIQLDRCVAFDDAVVQLQDRDPLRDQGPFSELAVTSRLWSGATALSDDYVAIDGRLGRIRLQVELALAPPVDTHVATLARS